MHKLKNHELRSPSKLPCPNTKCKVHLYPPEVTPRKVHMEPMGKGSVPYPVLDVQKIASPKGVSGILKKNVIDFG